MYIIMLFANDDMHTMVISMTCAAKIQFLAGKIFPTAIAVSRA